MAKAPEESKRGERNIIRPETVKAKAPVESGMGRRRDVGCRTRTSGSHAAYDHHG